MAIGVPHLRAFVAVVDNGGFGAAADFLGISQSAVSQAVASLERIAGRPVLTRGGVPRPTLLGEQILEHARVAVAAVSAAERLANRRDKAMSGELVLGAPPTICHGLLPGILTRWETDFPDLRVCLFEGEDDEVAAWLDGGTADLAVLVDPPRGYSGTVLGTDSFHAVLRSDHPLAGQPVVDLADLADDDFLLSAGGCERQVRELHEAAGATFLPRHQVRHLSTLFAMVRAGVGVSVVPGLADGMQGSDIVLRPLTQASRRTLVLAGPLHRRWHPAVEALIGTVAPGRAA